MDAFPGEKMFNFGGVKLNWFPGHMASSLKYMRNRLERDVELVLEVRDARIPYTSKNPLLQDCSKPRLVIFNKSDLTTPEAAKMLSKEGILMRKDRPGDIQKLLELIKSRFSDSSMYSKHRIMIMGIPNVGKSTILNALRLHGIGVSGKASATGFLPGVTRNVSEMIKIAQNPTIYLYDTPGITQPRFDCPEVAMKIALCGGLFDKVVGWRLLASYLLFVLNERAGPAELIRSFYKLQSNVKDINDFLTVVAERIGARKTGGDCDLERAANYFIRQFRLGKFGPVNLDI